MPLFSVILATKNRCNLLNRSINSILNQTFKDYELIIINDGSTDDTEIFIRQLDNPKIKLITMEKSLGCAGARNIGIQAAQADYILFIDDDDEYLPYRLTILNDYIKNNNTKNFIMYTDMIRVNRDGSLNYWQSPHPCGDHIINESTKDFQGTSLAMQQILIRKEAFNENGLLDITNPNMEDVDFYIRANKKYTFVRIPIPTVLYYDTGGVSFDSCKSIQSRLKIISKYENDLDLCLKYLICQIEYMIHQIALLACDLQNVDFTKYRDTLLSGKINTIVRAGLRYPEILELLKIFSSIKQLDEKTMLNELIMQSDFIFGLTNIIKEKYSSKIIRRDSNISFSISESYSWNYLKGENNRDNFIVQSKIQKTTVPIILIDWDHLSGNYDHTPLFIAKNNSKLSFSCISTDIYELKFDAMCTQDTIVNTLFLDNCFIEEYVVTEQLTEHTIKINISAGSHTLFFRYDESPSSHLLYCSFSIKKYKGESRT